MNTVEMCGSYGGDITHALSAWTSTQRELTPEKLGRIEGLLSMLAREDPPHESPFEKSFLHFLVRCETASHIHILKHRIAVSVNGESARYKGLTAPTFHIPDDWPKEEQEDLADFCEQAKVRYARALERLTPILGRKRAKESARFYLPYANQLTLDVAFNFRSFIHFLKLRMDDQAQDEIHEIANEMLALVRETGDFDLSLAAFGF